MSDLPNTLFLRLEGPLQAWGDPSKFVIRRTMDAPTKSGVIGLICCAMGRAREWVVQDPIPHNALSELAQYLIVRDSQIDNGHEPRRALLDLLSTLRMGVRVDRAGMRWWDYHTVGAKVGMLDAKGEIKRTATTKEIETLITRREYLADASFLVALKGDSSLIREIATALASPKWLLYLGRKCCPPSAPMFTQPRDGESWTNPTYQADLRAALEDMPWYPRHRDDRPDGPQPCLVEWQPQHIGDMAPAQAEVWYDVPDSLDPPHHAARFVTMDWVTAKMGYPIRDHTACPPPPRANYRNKEYQNARDTRWDRDHDLCVFCKIPLTKYNRTVQHITYRRAGGNESQDDLRSLCRLCHDAVTMIEYGLGMGLDRINPEDPQLRDQIIEKRDEIIRFRSLETRRRHLAAEEVE
ncbi:MAG: type I-E CRISPR-associated protein Cas5/CasD [Armatimonadota bacterium]|nr:type I-E CRISPR-associated protein Cas5/CasD [Armatimonadota bacterium]